MIARAGLIAAGYLLAAFFLLLSQNPVTAALGLVLLAYLVGGIPFGLLAGWMRGVDVRRHGSGNIGTTNVLRILGLPTAMAVFAADFLKGLLPVLLARWYVDRWYAPFYDGGWGDLVVAVTALAALAGHAFSPYLRFRGGRGIATGIGGLAGMVPWAAGVAFAIWVVLVSLTRYVSLGSVLGTASAFFLLLAWALLGRAPWAYLVYLTLGVPLIIFQHRDNIRRLASGAERKLFERKT